MIDGLRVADPLGVGAGGMDAAGHQRVWGRVNAATENHTGVTALLPDLITCADGLLVVIDGAKAYPRESLIRTGYDQTACVGG